MCIIIAAPADKHIKMRYLKNSWEANDDGAGFMFTHNRKVIIKKGFMTFKDFAEDWRQVPEDVPRIVHFRIRTHGLSDADNTHPFEVFPGELALAHNGILPFDPPKDSNMSDTAAFVEFVLKKLPKGWQRSPAILHLLDEYCGYGNKLAILAADGKITLVNEDKGSWEEGVWFSNLSFRTGGHYTRTIPYVGSYPAANYDYDEHGTTYPITPIDPAPAVDDRVITSTAGEDDGVLVAASVELELRGEADLARAAGKIVEADKLDRAADELLNERIDTVRRGLRAEFGKREGYSEQRCKELRDELADCHRLKRQAQVRAMKPTMTLHAQDTIGFKLGQNSRGSGAPHA